MDFNKLECRTTSRTCHCKVCDKTIERNIEKVIVFTPLRGHCDTVHICQSCVDKMNELLKR